MIRDQFIMEWTTVIKGDDPKRFTIEDVRAGKYRLKKWTERVKEFILGKKDA